MPILGGKSMLGGVFSNSNNVTFGVSGATVTASASFSTSPGGIAAGTQTASTGTVVFSNSNGLTFGMRGSSQITASYTVPSQSTQPGLAALSAGTQTITTGTAVFSNSNNVSFGVGSGASSSLVTASASFPAQTTQPGVQAISAGTQTATTGTVVFSNSNGISFGLGSGASTSIMTASYTVPSQSTQPAVVGVLAGGSTLTTGTVAFSNLNGISFGFQGGASSTNITASYTVPTQSTQPAIVGIAAGGSTATTGSVLLSNSNGVSFGYGAAGNSTVMTASVGAGATATGNLGGLAVNAATTYTSGTVVLSNSNGISFGTNAQTITASFDGVRSLSAGTSSGSYTGLTFSNSNNVSFGNNAGAITASAAFGGINDGVASVTAGQVNFSDSNGVSFGLNGSTMTGSIDALRSVSAGGSSGSFTGVTFSNSNGISFGISNGTITGSVGAPGTTGITGLVAGTQTATQGSISFANSNGISFGASGSSAITASIDALRSISAGTVASNFSGITMSDSNGVSFGLNAGTITASYKGPLQSRYFLQPPGLISSSAITVSQASVQYLQLPEDISFSRVDIPMIFSFGSTTTSNTAAVAFTSGMVIYSRNGSTLNPIVGSTGNTTYSYASNSANFSSVQSGRFVSFGLSTSLSAGEYFVYAHMSTATSSVGAATTNLGLTVSALFGSTYSASAFADFGALSGATRGVIPMMGMISSSVSATSQTLQMSQITVTGSAVRANLPVVLRNF